MNKVFSYVIKFLLLLVGIADFLGFLPPSLDIVDKSLAAIILLLFWLELKPAKFIVGKDSKILDIGIMVAFYVLVLDTFAALVPSLNFITQNWVSLISLILGLLLILVLSLAFASSKLTSPSVFHAVLEALNLKGVERFWLSRFLAIFLVLLAVSQYIFGLINQWFIVSLDKSLLILAVLFAVKDIQHSKIKAFNTLGDFDEELLKKANQLFTHSKTIGLGIGFLLVAHVLSDVGVYAVPYLLGNQPEGYYLSKLGEDASHYLPLAALWQGEAVKSFSLGFLYVLSGLGFLLLLLIPAFFCLALLFNVDWAVWVKDQIKGWMLGLVGICVGAFILAPWTFPRVIQSAGMYGADFQTFTISSGMWFSLPVTGVFLGLFLVMACFLSERGRMYGLGGLALAGLSFLGIFSWTYLRSSITYYGGAISSLGFEGWLLVLFLFLDVLFYVGSFIGFSRAVFSSLLNEVEIWLSSRWLVAWSFGMVVLAMVSLACMDRSPIAILTALSLFLVTCALFHGVFFERLKGRMEFRDDFVLALNLVMLSLLLAGVLSMLFSRAVSEKALNILVPLLLLGVGLFLSRKFGLRVGGWRYAGYALLTGVLFAGLFKWLGESLPLLPSNKVLAVLGMLFVAVYEELFFRNALFKLASLSYSFVKANALQSFFFALTHFLLLKELWAQVGSIGGMALYFLALFIFAWVMGLLVGKLVDKKAKTFSGSVWAAVLAHAVANILLMLL